MKISCIIPTCDRPEMLKESLISVFNQTIQPYEIIVVNNGTQEIQLPEKFIHLTKVHNVVPYIGVAQARNFGASLTTGEFLAFLDDDDLWNKNYLQNVSRAIDSNAICIISRLDKIQNNKIEKHKNALNNLTLKTLLVTNPGVTGSNIVISKDLFYKLSGYHTDLPPSEDKSLIIDALLKNVAITILPDNQAILRVHPGPRLTNPKKLSGGILGFVRRYGHLMTWEQYFYNWKKYYFAKHESGVGTSIFLYFITSIFLVTIKAINKIK